MKEILSMHPRNAIKEARAARRASGSPLRALETARAFDSLHPEAGGYCMDLRPFDSLPHVPPMIVVLTDPEAANELLEQHDFADMFTNTPTHNALRPLHGDFILYRKPGEQKIWHAEKETTVREFGRDALADINGHRIAERTADEVIGDRTTLSPYWTKQMIGQQMVTFLVGREPDPQILEDGLKSHTRFTRTSAIPLALGNTESRVGKAITSHVLEPYIRMLSHITDLYEEEPGGIVNGILQSLPHQEAADTIATLTSGLNNLRSLLDFSLYALANHPEFQPMISDRTFRRRFIAEVCRTYPVASYTVRRANGAFEFRNITIPQNSLIMCAAFAYGGEKYVDRADTFDPDREGLDEMAMSPNGQANIFSSGPRSCITKYLSPHILGNTLAVLTDRYTISCENDPEPVLGNISLRMKPAPRFTLTDANGITIQASTSYK